MARLIDHLLSYFDMFMTFLYAVLVLSVLALLGTAAAGYLRVRRELRTSDPALREFLQTLEQERELTVK